jgi:TldD protein
MRKLLLCLTVSLGCGFTSSPPHPVAARQPLHQAALRVEAVRPAPAPAAAPAAPLRALQLEAARFQQHVAKDGEPRSYFFSYEITDRSSIELAASDGALLGSDRHDGRQLDVEVRAGDYRLDSTHATRGSLLAAMFAGRRSWHLPVDDDPQLLRPTIWLATDQAHREARERYLRVRSDRQLRTASEDRSDDFSREEPLRLLEAPLPPLVADPDWEQRLRAYSALLGGKPGVLESSARLSAMVENRYFLSSERTMVQTGRRFVRLTLRATARSEDGMDLSREELFDADSLAGLPGDHEVVRRAQQLLADLAALRSAPLAEPYFGPAILDGGAAAVFFHEIFGHRVEGHRQKSDDEGQTFAKRIGTAVLPPFLDVYDDPTIQTLNGVSLSGFYRADNEGVLARRVSLVEKGVLRGFLMSRSPVRGFPRSNGHGRRQPGRAPVARQGNFIVHPRQVVSGDELKRQLIAEVKRQGKPYGLRFRLFKGGMTGTSRFSLQAFKVVPVLVYRVYPDGHEELIRGAAIEGTPLTAFSQVVAAADDMSVTNGFCGAESGTVPVGLASPSLLVARLEVTRLPSGREKQPLLPPPGRADEGGAR